MWNKYNDIEINEAAVQALKLNLNAFFEYRFIDIKNAKYGDMHICRGLDMWIRNNKLAFIVETKFNVNQAVVGRLIQYKNTLNQPLLLLAVHVPDHIGNKLKDGGINYIDTAGNAFMDQPGLYVYVKGNKPKFPYDQPARKTAFTATGLRAIFAFLCNDKLVDQTYRVISAGAGVALGTIGNIIKELRSQGYIVDMGKAGCRLAMKEKLFNRWVNEYPEKLRPKLRIGRFTGDTAAWQDMRLPEGHAQWGAEAAAAKMTNMLKPEIITIYVDREHVPEVLAANKLKADENGRIEILERFWDLAVADEGGRDTVPPILVYADLLATGDQRNVETAGRIYDEYILQHIR
jgi:hypothetical protein